MCGGQAITIRISGKVSPNLKSVAKSELSPNLKTVAKSESVAKSELCRQIGNSSDTNFGKQPGRTLAPPG